MPPRKRRTKKIAAPKTSSWPLQDGFYLSSRSIQRRAISAGPAVALLRERLGLGGGDYDAVTRHAVIAAQRAAEVPATGVVTEVDWDLIVNGQAPEPPADEE